MKEKREMKLRGKRIIVTGVSQGIGASTVRAYVREGATVSAVDILDEAGQQTVRDANAKGSGKATYHHCDIANSDEVFSVFENAEKEMGGLDVLAQVAGIENHKPAEDFTADEMHHMWSININGTIATNQAACKLMQKQKKGAIINFASDVGLMGMPYGGLYAASKGAVLSWTRTIAYEWAMNYNIRCNCVNPTIKTPMFEQYLARLSPEELEAFLAAEKQRVPLGGQMGDADRDMAPVMVFLASDDAGYINGQVICANGGRVMVR